MMRIKMIALSSGCAAIMVTANLFAATLEVGNPIVTLMAGQTIEIPLYSNQPIASDLTASGAFQPGDVTFTPGPGCHLSADNCTLLITAAPFSQNYLGVPVIVSESAAVTKALLTLSVIQPDEYAAVDVHSSQKISTPASKPIAKPANTPQTTLNQKPAPLQRSGNAVFYGIAEPHPNLMTSLKATHSHFTPNTNGPVYQIVALTNHDGAQPLSISITGPGADSFSLDDQVADYGANQNCAAITNIASKDSCLVIVKGKVGDPRQAPQTATLTIRGDHNNVATFKLTDTTYVYAAGGFNSLGSASVSTGDLVAQCTAGTCENALQGSTGTNSATTNFSFGSWINALAVTPVGNLIVGGVFGAIGGATTGSSGGNVAALLAQCQPGPVTGNACINQLGNGTEGNNFYAFDNGYIDAVTPPLSNGGATLYMYVGGDFAKIRNRSVPSGETMLARCTYSGTSPNPNCSNYMLNSSPYANKAISALDYSNSIVNAGGIFTQIGGYPGTPPTTGTTFATCNTSSCGSGFGVNRPDNSILGMTNDGVELYMGGTFKNIGGYISTTGYPLVKCIAGGSCQNGLASSLDANGYIEGIAYSAGNLYVGGKFTTIGTAPPVSDGNMLAICTPGGTCNNLLSDAQPYATGVDWGGNIAAIAVGVQTTITAE